MKQVIGVLSATVFTVTAVLAGTAPASAVTTCTASHHCYGEDQLEGRGTLPDAAGTDLSVSCLSVADRSTEFAGWEMWFITDTPQVTYETWVEEGMTSGTLQDGHQGFMWFWADKRPNGTYNEHYIKSATVGTQTNVSVYYAGNNNDTVYLGGSNIGTSAGNGIGGLWANAGAEVTTTQTTVVGQSTNFQYRNSSGWHWATPNIYNTGGTLWNVYGSGSYLSVSTGCGAAAKAAQSRGQAVSPMPANRALVRQRLIGIARHIATLTHDVNPGQILMTRSTRQTALRLLSGDKVNTNPRVYVLTLRGTFSSFRPAPGRDPGRIPPGHTLTVLVNATTGQVTDWEISNISIRVLTRLGAVTALR